MSNNIVKSKTFDASLISYDEPKTNSMGGKSIKVLYDGRAFKAQTPIMQTWGVTRRLDSDGVTTKGFDMSLRFDPSDRKSHKRFKQMCIDIQEKLIEDGIKNSSKWFGKATKSRELVESRMNTLLKYPRKKDNSGELDLSREPTLRPKFRFWDGAFTGSKLFKMGRSGSPEPLHEYSAEELGEYIETLVPMHSEVCCIVTFQKLWFVSGNFGLTVVIDEAAVKPALEYSKQSSIVYDSDDDEELERVDRMAVKNTNFGDDDDDDDEEEDDNDDESNLGGGGSAQEDADEEEAEVEAEEDAEEETEEAEAAEEVVVETPKPKKKRVVRKRKKKGE